MLTVVCSLGAALCNALASILQRKGARSVPERESMHLALLLDVLRRPIWLLGLLVMVAAFVLQAAALDSGDLALVQPILLAELPLTLLLAPLFFSISAGRRAWLGVVGMAAGLAAVLLAAAPRGGRVSASTMALIFTVISSLALIAVIVMVALRLEGSPRAAAFGTAAGTGFALTAGLMKQAVGELGSGVGVMFSSWTLYAMAIAGVISLYLWQNALQAGTLVAAQPAITLSDPIFATCIGVLVFGERIRLGGWIAIEVIGALVIALASVELARSPLVSGEGEELERSGQSGQPGRFGRAARNQEATPDRL